MVINRQIILLVGYPQWPADRSQDNDAFMPGQDGHHRDAQGKHNAQGLEWLYIIRK